jgi:hypothetical protein
MPGHYFLIQYEDKWYANNELYIDAVAKGEKALLKLLSSKAITGKLLMDQIVYPLDPSEQMTCRDYNPTVQDFDEAVMHFNVLSKEELGKMRSGNSEAFPGATVIQLKKETIPEFFEYRHITFFKVMDYRESQKYRMLPKMAAVKICGRFYIAINAVDVRVETPIIASLVN